MLTNAAFICLKHYRIGLLVMLYCVYGSDFNVNGCNTGPSYC